MAAMNAHGHVDGKLPWGLFCPACGGLPSMPQAGCSCPHHFQEVQTQEIAGFIYPICKTCGPAAGYSKHDGQQLLCSGCGQGFPGWFYAGAVRIDNHNEGATCRST